MVSTSTQNLHSTITLPENISILLVSSYSEDLTALRRILQHDRWDIVRASGCKDAASHLRNHGAAVVVCDRDLPDGDWKDLLLATFDLPHAPMLLVSSRTADETLWAEVLNLGGYDVLLKPFDRAEVIRVINMAWRRWWEETAGNRIGIRNRHVQYA